MSTLPEQFSAARNAQVEAQLAILGSFSARAVAGAEQLLALNLSTSRAAFEQSSSSLKQLLSTKDPRDLLALTTQGQQQFDSLLAYGRALVDIATGVQAAPAPAPLAILAAPAPAIESAPEAAAAERKPAVKTAKPAPFPTVNGTAAAPAQRDMPAPKASKKK